MIWRLILLLGLAAACPSHAGAQVAFQCTGDIYQVQSGQLRVFDPTQSTYRDIGPPSTNYNAIGYSLADNLIYGIQSRKIIRVDATGAVTVLFALPFNSASADMDAANSLWIQRGANLITRFNVLDGTSTDLTLTGAGLPTGGVDIAFVETAQGDRIVAVGTSDVAVVDPATGATTSATVANYPTNEGSSGATWADAAGRVFTFKNDTGNVYEIRDYLSSAPSARLVARGVTSSNNDGASCRAKPFPNFAPLAFDDAFSTPLQTAVTGNLIADNGNGADNDPDLTVLTVATAPVDAPSNGSVALQPNGIFTYVPAVGFAGIDSFTYRVTDASGLSATAVARVTVTTPRVTVVKSVALYTPTAALPAIVPQNDLIYAIEVSNAGTFTTGPDSLSVVDPIPAELAFFDGDIDQGGPDRFPGTSPVGWTDAASGLTFDPVTDIAYSDQVATPRSFDECRYVPTPGYDARVLHLCLNPKGRIQPGGAKATFYFRARIK